MNLPPTELIPDDPDHLPPARRRRARRLLAPLNADERADFIGDIAHRASPSFDFFLFSFLAGIVISAGLLLDEPALAILGALVAPVMAPVVGLSLGAVSGSLRFFLRSLAGLLVGCILVFLTGMVSGYLAALRNSRGSGSGVRPRTDFLGKLPPPGCGGHIHIGNLASRWAAFAGRQCRFSIQPVHPPGSGWFRFNQRVAQLVA